MMKSNTLFNINGYILPDSAKHNDDLNFHSLPPFLRSLLISDGTITKSLEAYFGELVSIDLIEQGDFGFDKQRSYFDNVEPLLVNRKVNIIGQKSGCCYLSADSMINTETLPVEIKYNLINNKAGIGQNLREYNISTYRQLITIEYNGMLLPKEQQYVERLYNILIDNSPAIVIKERYPLTPYLLN